MLKHNLLLIGDADRPEFRPAREAMQGAARVTRAADVAAAVEMLANGPLSPDMIVLAQTYPGQFSHEAVDRLRRLAPLARVLGLLGSWCEGEMRSGQPWPGAIRLYWHQWPARGGRELALLAGGEPSAWSLPVTASEEEQLLAEIESDWPRRQGLVAICAPSAAMAEWLAEACRSRGFSTVWLREPRPATVSGALAAIFDGSDLGEPQAVELRQLVAMLSPAPVITLLDFPRSEDCERACACGAGAVLAKPLRLEDLFWQLDSSVACAPAASRPA